MLSRYDVLHVQHLPSSGNVIRSSSANFWPQTKVLKHFTCWRDDGARWTRRLQFILRGNMNVSLNSEVIHPIAVDTFSHGVTKDQRNHPPGCKNVSAKCNLNLSNSFWDISLWTDWQTDIDIRRAVPLCLLHSNYTIRSINIKCNIWFMQCLII